MRRVTRPAPAAQVREGRRGESVKVVVWGEREETSVEDFRGSLLLGLEAGERARWEPRRPGWSGVRVENGVGEGQMGAGPGLGGSGGFAV